MWWIIIKKLLDRNGSPSWQRINNIMSIWNMSKNMTNSARTQGEKEDELGESI